MLFLSDILRKTIINTGQTTISLDTFGYSLEDFSEVLETSLGEYEKYRPLIKKEIFPLDPNGYNLPHAIRVLNIRLWANGFQEFVSPLDFRFWEFTNGVLYSNYTGTFYVEYLSKYRYDYALANLNNINYITRHEDKVSFVLKDGFKKGTLNISLTDVVSNITYSLSDDLSSYNNYESSFTVNVSSNELVILEVVGKKLKTGSIVTLSSSGTTPTGLNTTTDYYVIKTSDTSIKLASTMFNALNNIEIDLIDSGVGTNKIITKYNDTNIHLVGSLGVGSYDSNTKRVTFTLNDSFEGVLNASFRTENKAIQDMNTDETLFLKLFQANFLISLGLKKAILKNDELPWDFSVDDLVSMGQKMKDSLDTELPEKSIWWRFR